MKAKSYLPILFCQISLTIFSQPIEYPIARKEIAVDTFFNSHIIKDEYRYFESLDDVTTSVWIDKQNRLSEKILSKANTRNNTYNLIDEYSYVINKVPNKVGENYFYYGTYGALSNPALFIANAPNQRAELLIDPNYISRTDNIGFKGFEVSKNSKYLAYKFNRNGSDWSEIKVVNTSTGIHTKDHLKNVKFSDIAWKENGFFYSKFESNSKYEITSGQKVYYHSLNTEQSKDSLIFERNNPSISFDFQTSTSERFFILREIYEDTDIINLYFIDYNASKPAFRPLVRKFEDNLNILDEHEDKLIAITHLNANNGCIVEIDPYNPKQWKTIIPEFSNATLLYAMAMKNKIIAVYQSNQRPILLVYDYSGKELFSKQFQVGTSISGFSGLPDDEELVYSYRSYTVPSVGYIFNLNSFKSRVIMPTEVTYTFNDIIYEETQYTSKDGTNIPILLVYKEGMERDGNNPTLLNAYGGFGVVSTPHFDPGIVYFVRKGGVFAFANIRGGGDLGREWRDMGRGLNKQTSFDDFIAGAEFLISSGITSPKKLASTGASNGGLVVAASAIQRPDLFKAVVPEVAPLDMLRFELFTIGHYHTDEYGSVSNKLQFENLLSYSPLHNIELNTNYPAMLIMTSENDDRVPPLHSYKFAAKLQNNPTQTNPILLRVENNAGHHGASNLYSSIKEISDKYAFIMKMIDSK